MMMPAVVGIYGARTGIESNNNTYLDLTSSFPVKPAHSVGAGKGMGAVVSCESAGGYRR